MAKHASYITATLFLMLAFNLNFYHTLGEYSGCKVVEVEFGENEVQPLRILLNSGNFDIWAEHGNLVHVRLCGEELNRVRMELDANKLKNHVIIDNIQKLIYEETDVKSNTNYRKTFVRIKRDVEMVSNWIVGTYVNYTMITGWMHEIDEFFGNLVSVFSIGKTYENRDLYVMKLGVPGVDKPALWLDGGIHAREWISPASLIYFIYQLLENYNNGDNLLKDLDVYILPIVNPDGYDYTFNSSTRLWRKNRAPNRNDSMCPGVDLNRNFPFHWNEGGVISRNECSELYNGDGAGSELETQAIMNFLSNNNDTIKGFISVHAYMQLFMHRWAYTTDKPQDLEEQAQLARKAVTAIFAVTGVEYRPGSSPDLLYTYSGGSADWARGVANIPVSFTIELRDTGKYGFLLPERFVIPVGQELFAGVNEVIKFILSKYSRVTPDDRAAQKTDDSDVNSSGDEIIWTL